MKKRFAIAALGLAVALLAFGQSSANANHFRGRGCAVGGVRGVPVYPVVPRYGHVHRGHGSHFRGHNPYHRNVAPFGRSGFNRFGYGRRGGIQIGTPGFFLGLGR